MRDMCSTQLSGLSGVNLSLAKQRTEMVLMAHMKESENIAEVFAGYITNDGC